jgi:hypothetical protein
MLVALDPHTAASPGLAVSDQLAASDLSEHWTFKAEYLSLLELSEVKTGPSG